MTAYQDQSSFKRVASVLIKFSFPLILSGILQQLYNWADAFIVGNVEGELALAAVGATSTVINFYVTVITGFTLGLTIYYAQKFGSGDTAIIPKILSTFSLLLGSVFLLLAALGICLTGPLLQLLHTTPDTIALAEDYLRIIFIGVPFLALYNVYSAALRGIGDSRAPFYSILISSIINVIFDILFVAVFRWGVSGAAIATVIAQAAMTVFLVLYGSKKYPLLRFKWGRKIFDRTVLVQGVRLGLPPMIQSGVSAAGNLVLQNFMNGFGTQTVTAVTTAYRVDSLVLLPIINLGSGISTIVAQNYGAGEQKLTRKVLAVGTVLMVIVSLLLTVLVIPTGGYLISLFGAGAQATEIGSNFFQRIACFYLVFGLATAIRGYLEGLGDVAYSGMAGIFSLIVRIALSYLMVSFFGNMVIAYAEAFSWIVLFALYFIRMCWKQKTQKAV